MNSILINIDASAMTLLVSVSVVLLLVILVASLTLLRAFKTVLKLTMPDLEQQEIVSKKEKVLKTDQQTFWQKVLGLRPMEEEEDLLIDHTYDGIQELDNPTPTWFNALFYSSIVFAIGYLLFYHVFGWGMTQDQEYLAEMQAAEKQRMEFLATSGTNIDENSVELDLSPEMVIPGQEIYLQSCGVCHGNQGEGMIGPNLTDEYWLHGGDIKDIFRVVKYGVPDKGMVPWESSLTPVQIAQVSNFIASIGGTTPPNPKEPQGDKHEVTVPAESTEITTAAETEL
jgi:cytochrome c oxidase cbb3-type subunit 3